MPLSTYAELQASIAAFLLRDDLTAVVPDFIALCEANLQRDVKHWRMDKRADFTIASRFEDVPSDFVSPIRFTVGSTENPLAPISVQDMQDRRSRANDNAGTPCHYALVADQFEFYPTPTASITGSLHYRSTIPALSDSNTTNWLLTAAPDAYLYGALLHSAPYLQEDARVATWGALYSQAIARLNSQGDAGKFGGAGKRKRVRS